MELILVADGCTDDTVIFAQHYSTPWKLHVLEQPGLGPSIARNRGAAQAIGDVLIFLDDDMEVIPEFVAAHMRVQQSHPQTVAVGTLRSVHLHPDGFFGRSLRDWWEGKFFRMRQPGYRFHYDDLFGGNFSVRADFLAQVGGFDPELRCHEDYELGVRLLAAGANCKLAIAAVADHHDVTEIDRAFQRRIAEGRADIYLANRHTGLHEQMPLVQGSQQGSHTLFSRALRYLAFRQPFLGDRIARTCQLLLPFLEFIWLFSIWQALFYHLQDYWYWRGVGMVAQPAMIQKLFSVMVKHPPAFIIDLAQGVAPAEHDLDITHPTSARLFVGKQWVGDVPGLPGMERLKSDHLHQILTTELSAQLVVALALAKLMPESGGDEAWQKAWQLPVEPEESVDQNDFIWGSKKIIEIELSNGIPNVDTTGYNGLHALIRSRGYPLGCITLVNLKEPLVSSLALHQAIIKNLGYKAIPLAWAPLPPPTAIYPPISVIVCTRNRTSQLAECLQSLLVLDYQQYEILVVDNAPGDEQTAQLVADLPVRYVREERPGLDFARNCGLHEACHSIVAFIDDDAWPDRGWLRAIARAFNDSEVMAVTGPVMPAKLETQAQNLFEFGYGGMNHGFERRVVRHITYDDMGLLWASAFGVGTNMAFRKPLFSEVGGFDVALDVGMPSGGGGDVEMLHRLVARGHTLVYEPTALVWHQHRPGMNDLRQLVSNNGRSFGCYLLTSARNRTVGYISILYFALRFWLWGWIGKRLLRPRSNGFPRHMVWRELLAALGSPMDYLRSRVRAQLFARPSD
jgi:glycosyltransferase involved in cell wall biosynthesis